MIQQGDVYWLELGEAFGSEPGYRRPYVVIQNNSLNRSRIRTVVICPITSSIHLARSPGNVLLDKGEGGLTKQSVVNVSQIFTVDKSRLEEKAGAVSMQRVRQVLDGIHLVLEPREP